MPVLTLPYPSFVPFTVIRSAEVNANNAAISTLLNTTGIDDTNIQNAGITRATKLKTGTANAFVINAPSTGAMSELVAGNNKVITTDGTGVPTAAAFLTNLLGGLGFSLVVSTLDVEKVIRVNTGGTGLELSTVPEPASAKIFSYLNLS
jgi:hypothetical protein